MEIGTTGKQDLPTTQLPGLPGGDLRSRQTAWLREMERQELQGWLGQPALPPHTLPEARATLSLSASAHAGQMSVRHAAEAGPKVAVDAIQTAPAKQAGSAMAAVMATTSAASAPATMAMPSTSVVAAAAPIADETGIAPRTAGPGAQPHQQVADALMRVLQPASAAATPMRVLVSVSGWSGKQMPPQVIGSTETPDRADESGESGEIAKTPRTVTPAEPQTPSPLRVHVESDGANARVWLGVDAALAMPPEQLGQLVDGIQRTLADSDIALDALTLNGRPIFNAHRRGAGASARELLQRSHGETQPYRATPDHLDF